MLTHKDLQELVEFKGDGALVLSLYLDTDFKRQTKESCKLNLRERLHAVMNKSMQKDVQKIEHFFDVEYAWHGKGVAVFSCQEKGLWRVYPLAVPVHNLVFVAETPYVKLLTDLLDEYGQYGVALIDQENARLFGVQLGEIQEEHEIYGEVVKHHKQGGKSQAVLRRRADNQAAQNLRVAAEAVTEFCKQKECKALVLAGAEGALAPFRQYLPKSLQKQVIGMITADMDISCDEVLERSMAIWLAAKHAQERALVEQAITAAAKGGMGVTGLADTTYAIRQGRVHKLLVQQSYEAPGAVCGHCGYISPAVGQKCLFDGSEMKVVDNAVDVAVQKTLETGGSVITVEGNEKLAQAGHIVAVLRY